MSITPLHLSKNPYDVAAYSFLVAVNVVNFLSILSILISVDSPLKKPAINLHHFLVKISSRFYGVGQVLVNISLLAILLWYSWDYFCVVQQSGNCTNSVAQEEHILRIVVSAYTFLITWTTQMTSDKLHAIGPEKAMELEGEIEKAKMLNYQPFPKPITKVLFSPFSAVLRPEWTGLENIPNDAPAFYVMNHSLFGLEMASFVDGLYQQKGKHIRALADHFHFGFPYGSLLKAFGAVDGTRENVDTLMENQRDILVYPGGGQEVLKHSSVEKYSLLWKERLGFARMAIKHGYPIIPCACVGIEDMIDIVFDINANIFRKGQFVPVPKPVSPGKVQRIYFWVGEPIPTKQYNGDWKNDVVAREVRDKVKAAVEAGVASLKQRQQVDPSRFTFRKNETQGSKRSSTSTEEKVLAPALKKTD